MKIGPAMLYGASGATRKGTLKGGKWHGEATYTTQVSDQFIIFRELCGIFSGWRNQERALGQWPASLGPGEVSDNTHYPVTILIISLAMSLGLSYSHRWTQSALTNLIIKTRLTRMKKTLTSQMFIL